MIKVTENRLEETQGWRVDKPHLRTILHAHRPRAIVVPSTQDRNIDAFAF